VEQDRNKFTNLIVELSHLHRTETALGLFTDQMKTASGDWIPFEQSVTVSIV